MVLLHVAREQFSQQPETLLSLRLVRVPPFFALSVFDIVLCLVLVVFIWIVHEVDQIRVVVLDRVSIQQDVLLPERTILLLLFNDCFVALSSCVVVGNLRLKFNHGVEVLRGSLLLDLRIERQWGKVAQIPVVVLIRRIPHWLVVGTMRDGELSIG